ncbi:MAG TPA: amidohydrolase family protein [Desulfomonilaceae bacterium]|nr:amidohydrolase family protein [Desulfomonilaceae bacterium]
MTVLDIHVHVGRREHLTARFAKYFEELLGPGVLTMLDTITPHSFVQYLDREGIDYAVLLAEYSPKATGVVPNEFVAEFCSETERLIPFGSLNLDGSTDPAVQAETCVKDLGCKGLKLLPSYGHFSPDDARVLPAYEVARDLGIPILFHTGTSLFPGTRVRYAHPLLLDDIAEDFPELSIVMCHGGRPFWYKEAEWMLQRHPNVYVDVSGIPPKQIPHVMPKLEKFPDRFLFGSDWPNIASIGEQVSRIKNLPFSPATIQALLWENAARLLHL